MGTFWSFYGSHTRSSFHFHKNTLESVCDAPCFTDKDINLPRAQSKVHILCHHGLSVVTPEVLCEEKKQSKTLEGRHSRVGAGEGLAESCHRPPSGLDSAKERKQPPSISCGNLIGSLFLAVRSQTKNLPPRLSFKVFSSGRLSLTSSRSHRPTWFLPPLGLPQRPLLHLLPSLSHCILIICLQLCFPSQPGYIFSGSRHIA